MAWWHGGMAACNKPKIQPLQSVPASGATLSPPMSMPPPHHQHHRHATMATIATARGCSATQIRVQLQCPASPQCHRYKCTGRKFAVKYFSSFSKYS